MAKRGRQGEGGGRPQFNGKPYELVLQKLREAWAMGCPDCEAAALADISAASLSDFLKRNPQVAEEKSRLLENPFLIARKSITEGMKTSPELALKYMERKRRDEFSERKEIVVDDKQRVEWSNAALNNPELADEISKLMGKIAKK